LVRQAKSKQKIIDKMEAAGLIEKIEVPKVLNFRFEDVDRLPPPILAVNEVAFSYSGKKEDYLYRNLSFGIEYVYLVAELCLQLTPYQHGLSYCAGRCQRCGQVDPAQPHHWRPHPLGGYDLKALELEDG
jgi:ATP-binding cassette subfamily F protein 2